jgi:hypothetical protein
MLGVHKIDTKRRLFIALLIAAIAVAFSPLAAIDAHALLPNDAYEPNDTTATVKPIAIDAIVSANLSPNSNNGEDGSTSRANDYYSFTVTEPAPYTVEFNHVVPAGATESDFAYVSVRTDADASKGGAYIKLNVDKTYVTTDWLNAGTYHIEVTAYSASDAGFDQPYEFVVKKGGYIDDAMYFVRHNYTGSPISPFRLVYSKYTSLVLDQDYTVSGTQTSVGMGTATVTGIGAYYGSHQVSFAVYPDQVMLKNVKAGKKKLTVSWYKVKSVDKYVVQYKLTSSNKWKSKTVSSKKSSVVLSKLKKGKKYNVRIYAYKTVGGKKYNSINLDETITTAYTDVPGFSENYSMKTVKVK